MTLFFPFSLYLHCTSSKSNLHPLSARPSPPYHPDSRPHPTSPHPTCTRTHPHNTYTQRTHVRTQARGRAHRAARVASRRGRVAHLSAAARRPPARAPPRELVHSGTAVCCAAPVLPCARGDGRSQMKQWTIRSRELYVTIVHFRTTTIKQFRVEYHAALLLFFSSSNTCSTLCFSQRLIICAPIQRLIPSDSLI